MAESFPISGNIDPKSFPFLLMDLHRQGATGSLKVEGPSYPKALYYRSGRILFGSSNDPKDQLGAILIENGKITAEQLADVNTKVGPGNPLAKVLAESGFVSQRELGEAARIKVERILSDIIGYTTGAFEFEDGVLPKGAVDLKLATEKLVLASVRRIADRAFVLRHLEGLDVVLGAPARGPRWPRCARTSGDLPNHLDGHRSLKEAARLARIDEFDAAKIACGLLFLGLVEPRTARRRAGIGRARVGPGGDGGDGLRGRRLRHGGPLRRRPGRRRSLLHERGRAAGARRRRFGSIPDARVRPVPSRSDASSSRDAPEATAPEAFLPPEPEPESHTLPRTPAFVSPEAADGPVLASPSDSTGFALGPEVETTALPVIEPPPPRRDDAPPNFSMPPFSAGAHGGRPRGGPRAGRPVATLQGRPGGP